MSVVAMNPVLVDVRVGRLAYSPHPSVSRVVPWLMGGDHTPVAGFLVAGGQTVLFHVAGFIDDSVMKWEYVAVPDDVAAGFPNLKFEYAHDAFELFEQLKDDHGLSATALSEYGVIVESGRG